MPATLIGLHGRNLFQALVALRLPADATKNVHLEVALAARRLALQEFVDLHMHMYEAVLTGLVDTYVHDLLVHMDV